MLRVKGEAMMVDKGGELRTGLARHHTLGANNFLLRMLLDNDFGQNIGARPEEFQTAIGINREFLSTRTADVTLENATLENGELSLDVVIDNHAGHKLPTSFPSRRAWVHITVTDGAGNVVFESGEYDANGMILDDDLDLDPTTIEPHYDEITSPDQVQIYESVMVTTTGLPTTTLLRGSRYGKDNRIPPSGFDKTSVPEDIQVVGAAMDDPDFNSGSDTVHYRVDVPDAQGQFTVSVELLYQSISYRWAMDMHNFAGDDAPEVGSFLGIYAGTSNVPEVIASEEVVVGE